MVFRLQGSAPQTSAVNFNGGSIAQAGQTAAAGLRAGVDAVDGYLQQEAELFYQTEMTDFNIGMGNDLRDIAGASLAGEGYVESAGAAFDRRRADLLARANGNPYKTALINQHFEQTEAEIRDGFASEQRGLAVDYGISSIGRQTDDAMQAASRTDFDVAGLSLGSRSVNPAGNGITNISLDFNASASGGARGTEVIIPDNASPEIRAAADNFNRLMVDFAARRGIDQPNRGVRTRSQNGRGVSNTVHVEPFFNDNVDLQRAIDANFDEFAQIYEQAFGGLEGVRIIPPHGVGADRGAVSSVFQNETSFGERLVGRLMERRGVEADVNGIPVYQGEPVNVFDNPDVANRRDDIFSAINAIPGITANQRDELRREAESSIAGAALTRLGEQNAPAALATLRSGAYDEQLSYSQDQRLRNSMEADITRMEQERMSAVRTGAVAQANDYSAWNANGRQGEAPPALNQEQYMSLTGPQRAAYERSDRIGGVVQQAQIMSLENADEYLEALAPSGAGYDGELELFEAAREVFQGRFVQETAEGAVNSARDYGVAPNTDIEGVEEILDDGFQSSVAASDQPIQAASDWVVENRFVPDAFEAMIGQAMSSDNPSVRQQAVENVARINAQNPRVLGDVSNPAIDRAIAIDALTSRSVSQEMAEKMTAGFVSPAMAADRERNLSNWQSNETGLEESAMTILQERIDQRGRDLGLSRGEATAAIPPGVWGGFSDLVRDAYAVTGNVEASVAVAERSFFATHGVTYQGGEPVWQVGAAEAVYHVHDDPARNSAWIQTQARDAAERSLGENVTEVILTPNGDPLREATPEYNAIALLEDGRTVAVPDLFRPDRNRELAIVEREGRDAGATLGQVRDEAITVNRDREALEISYNRNFVAQEALQQQFNDNPDMDDATYQGFLEEGRRLRREADDLWDELRSRRSELDDLENELTRPRPNLPAGRVEPIGRGGVRGTTFGG